MCEIEKNSNYFTFLKKKNYFERDLHQFSCPPFTLKYSLKALRTVQC